jgi:hypothetical protein
MALVNAMFLATAMHRSRLVPHLIPTIGLVGIPLLLTSGLATSSEPGTRSQARQCSAPAPSPPWELSLGVWLAVMGVRRVGLPPAPVEGIDSRSLAGATA